MIVAAVAGRLDRSQFAGRHMRHFRLARPRSRFAALPLALVPRSQERHSPTLAVGRLGSPPLLFGLGQRRKQIAGRSSVVLREASGRRVVTRRKLS